VILRASVLLGRVSQNERSGRRAVEAVLVGGAYDTARALALIAKPSHDLRRRG
jgi:hypothetical protein